MLRRKMLAVAVATTLMAPAVFADSKNVDMYGVIAYGWMQDENGAGDKDWVVLNESRIGFRGSRELKNAPKFIWQIESGFLGADGLTGAPWESGTLGTRDTFGGFEGGFGKVRFGRLLTPFFEVLDWPYANGGVGPVVESINIPGGGNLTRHSNTIRWDSPGGGAVSGGVSIGRGNPSIHESTHLSTMLNVKAGPAMIHAGYEMVNGMAQARSAVVTVADANNPNLDGTLPLVTSGGDVTDESDASTMLLGFELPIGGGFSTYGVYVKGKSEWDGGGEYERDMFQLAFVYGAGDWIFKVTHAENGDLEFNGSDVPNEEGGAMDAVQALYILDPSAVAYARYVKADDPAEATAWWNKSRLLFGMEYYY